MAIAANFNKSRAQELLDALTNGKPIEGGPWTVYDMLAVAGACFFGVMSHGPALAKDVDWSQIPMEHREAADETLFADIHAAIEYYGHLTMLVADGEYDEKFHPQYRAIITTDGAEKRVTHIDGVRNSEE